MSFLRPLSLVALCAICTSVFGQHNNEFFSDGALIHIQAGAEVYVRGDFHSEGGTIDNDGFIQVEGNLYSNSTMQQRGTGTVRLHNENVNIGDTQFISGSFAVRGGQSQIGVDDGSFYNLELANDQGIVYLVGTGNVADVRNSVDFDPATAAPSNRIITHDISGGVPANGNMYTGVFGLMNPAAGLGSMLNNTISVNGNLSTVDAGYVQGQFRRAVSAAGGSYGFPLGLEPAGAGAARGVQYSRLDLDANTYDVITGYFEVGSDNTVVGTPLECSGYTIDYYGGTDHGEWDYTDITASGSGIYEMFVWPQDATFSTNTVWLITKDATISGTADDCGPSPVGLSRAGFNGFSKFGVAGSETFTLPIELTYIDANPIDNKFIKVDWQTALEINNAGFELQRSENGIDFIPIAWIDAQGNKTTPTDYEYDDHDVIPGQLYFYKAKQVDFDGTESFTPIVSASIIPQSISVIVSDLIPNPASDHTQLIVDTDQDMDVNISLFDALGKLVSTQPAKIETGNNRFDINTSQLAVGTYNVILQTQEKRFVKRLLVVR